MLVILQDLGPNQKVLNSYSMSRDSFLLWAQSTSGKCGCMAELGVNLIVASASSADDGLVRGGGVALRTAG